jgi:hypothetical protein
MQDYLLRCGRRFLFGASAAEKLVFESNSELLHGGRVAKAEPENNRSYYDHVQNHNQDAYNEHDHFNLPKPAPCNIQVAPKKPKSTACSMRLRLNVAIET